MGIYVRRGMEADFDPEKMKPGEWAVSINSDRKKQKIWMCFAPGVVKRMGTYEDFVDQIENATDEIKQKYITAFSEILKQIEDDKNVVDEEYQYVVSFKKAIDNTYIPQITAYANAAASSAKSAATAKTAAETYKNNAQTYMNNAKSYMDAAKTAAASITGALKPKGTVTFANLPNISSVETGAMYNISTAFTSVEKLFKDGGKIQYPAGTNVYKTEDGMWDCLGGELSDYLMKADIDTAVEEAMPDYTTSSSLQELVSGESVKSALGKIKTAVKNVITIVKLLGSTDISKIGNGTVTGAISNNATTINKVINKQATDLKSTNTKIDEVTTTAAANKKLLGSTSISSIGNGTVTDAISTLNSNFSNISQKIYSKDLEAVTVDISNKTRLKISFVTEHGFCLVFGEANHTAFGYIVTYTDCIELKGGYKTERYGNTWMITLGNWATATIIRGSIAGMVVDVD